MKTANVTEVRDVRASESYDPAYTDPVRRARVEELLRSYPATTPDETAEIVEFLSRGKHLDVGLVTAKDEFKEKVSTIRRDHSSRFRPSAFEVVLFLLLVLTPLALLVWLPHLLGRY